MAGNARGRRRRNSYQLGVLTAVLALVLAALILVAVMLTGNTGPSGPTDSSSQATTGPTSTPTTPTSTPTIAPTIIPTTALTDPPIMKEAMFILCPVVNMLMNTPVINSGATDGDYDFKSWIRYLSD